MVLMLFLVLALPSAYLRRVDVLCAKLGLDEGFCKQALSVYSIQGMTDNYNVVIMTDKGYTMSKVRVMSETGDASEGEGFDRGEREGCSRRGWMVGCGFTLGGERQ